MYCLSAPHCRCLEPQFRSVTWRFTHLNLNSRSFAKRSKLQALFLKMGTTLLVGHLPHSQSTAARYLHIEDDHGSNHIVASLKSQGAKDHLQHWIQWETRLYQTFHPSVDSKRMQASKIGVAFALEQ